ncbi:MAG TPA: class I SAM-dependent methyltransferase [Thermoanaerobaculia bacterium]|nr:class I SAM-dependent methyltransferase [Thermoanaerobaculia bacterium]
MVDQAKVAARQRSRSLLRRLVASIGRLGILPPDLICALPGIEVDDLRAIGIDLPSQYSRRLAWSYWRTRNERSENAPGSYLGAVARSAYLVSLIPPLPPSAAILELGCNVGRNLEHLRANGCSPLTGIEINPQALEILRREYPELGTSARILEGPIEHHIRRLAKGEFDLVFTMAVLEHLSTQSEFVFREMVRVSSKYVLTIEDEETQGRRHFRRDYGQVFRGLGCEELVADRDCERIDLAFRGYVARVFSVPGHRHDLVPS